MLVELTVLTTAVRLPEHSSVFRVPGGDALVPLLPRRIVLIHDSEKLNWVGDEIRECVYDDVCTVVEGDGRWPSNRKSAVPCRSRRIWPRRTSLGENKYRPSKWRSSPEGKQPHRNVLDQFLRHIFQIEFGSKF